MTDAPLDDKSLPRDNGELVFEAPWQARALAIAVALVDRLGLPWETFRRRLMDEIAKDPQCPYYESWSAALESMVVELKPGDARGTRQGRADRTGAAVSYCPCTASTAIRNPAGPSMTR